MARKDILVHIDNGPRCSIRLDAALGLAVKHGAHLVGLYVLTRSHIPGCVRVEIPDDLLQQQARAIEQAAAETEGMFDERVRGRVSMVSGGARRACLRRSSVCTGVMPILSSSGRGILRGKKVPMVIYLLFLNGKQLQ
jgi:nucleotide-binding universal stress UspA family protein